MVPAPQALANSKSSSLKASHLRSVCRPVCHTRRGWCSTLAPCEPAQLFRARILRLTALHHFPRVPQLGVPCLIRGRARHTGLPVERATQPLARCPPHGADPTTALTQATGALQALQKNPLLGMAPGSTAFTAAPRASRTGSAAQATHATPRRTREGTQRARATELLNFERAKQIIAIYPNNSARMGKLLRGRCT